MNKIHKRKVYYQDNIFGNSEEAKILSFILNKTDNKTWTRKVVSLYNSCLHLFKEISQLKSSHNKKLLYSLVKEFKIKEINNKLWEQDIKTFLANVIHIQYCKYLDLLK